MSAPTYSAKTILPSENGLTSQQAAELLATHGPNTLPEQQPPSNWQLVIAQLKNPLVFILVLAGLVTLALNHVSDAVIIGLAILVNTVLGFIQEKRANQAFAALKRYVTHQAEVIRDGQRQLISADQIVPGEIVILAQGAQLPADGQVIFANRAFVEEAIITGEGTPVIKQKGDPVYMGTTVSLGQIIIEVTQTGVATKIGSIASQIQRVQTDTPLKTQLSLFSQKLAFLIIGLTIFVFSLGLWRGNELVEILTTSIALAVSSIPEGLVVSLTVVLAVGMQRILKRRGLVKRLDSAETLGSVTTICVDKTGTITEGKMQVVEAVGDQEKISQQVLLANDLDDPIVIAAYNWGQQHSSLTEIEKHPRLDSIPFSSTERFFVSLHTWDTGQNLICVNGAPDVLLEWTTLSKSEKQKITDQINQLTAQGRRLIGYAQKKVATSHQKLQPSDAKKELEWVGLLAFFDPVRSSVKENLKLAQQAGIAIKVITGDYPKTTEYVMNEIGLPVTADQVMTGDELQKLTVAELAEKVKVIRLFARTTPDQKHLIVQALQRNHEVVAMMGDGVNDAPAIHQADIGIAVNEASDVSRETADLVLLDSNFSTIVAAIEEGRAIFDNIRKIVLYLLCDAFAEILVVVCSILFQLPLPITAVQIIWINLVSDGFPGLALTIDTKRPGLMKEPPRSPAEQIVTRWMIQLICLVSAFAGGVALVAFILTYQATGDLTLARSVTFLILGINSLVYVFSVRSLLVPFWKTDLFENRWLVVAVGAGFTLQTIPFWSTSTRAFFGVVPLSLPYWLAALGLSLCIFLVVELAKPLLKKTLVKPSAKTAHHLAGR